MLRSASGALPEFLRVTARVALVLPTAVDAKVKCSEENSRKGPLMPEPVNGMTCGLLCVLSVRVIVPLLGPAPIGIRVTLIVHVSPGKTVALQLLSWEKGPVAATLAMWK